jgi:hypothetical protein
VIDAADLDRAAARDISVPVSIVRQHGVDPEVLVSKVNVIGNASRTVDWWRKLKSSIVLRNGISASHEAI